MDKDVVLQLPVKQWEGPFTADIQAERWPGWRRGGCLYWGNCRFF